jgi:hypothetical protein
MGCLKSKYEKQLTEEERTIATQNFLKHDFPLRFLIFSSAFGILIAILTITFGIVAVSVKAHYYYVATGIWVGAYMILVKISTILLSIIDIHETVKVKN